MSSSIKKTKAELVSDIYDKIVVHYCEQGKVCSVYKKDVAFIVDSFLEDIKNSVLDDKIIELRSFGTFYKKLRKGKDNARNLYSGEICSTEDHFVPLFKAGTDFKNLLLEKNSKKQKK